MARCRTCKTKFTPKYLCQKNCLEKDDCIKAELEYKKKLQEKSWKKHKAERKPYTHSKEYKKSLQDNINLLARKIDASFNYNCIDCDRPLIKQVHGAHFHNVGGNENIRFNLHNIHSATSHCNKYNSEHKVGYRNGIVKRYSAEYLEYIDIEIPKTYSYIGLNEVEIVEKLAIVRKIIREFDTYKFHSAEQARRMFNKIIGIYK